jgi:hypothetical protein
MSYKKIDPFTAGVILGLALAILALFGIFKTAGAGEASLSWAAPTRNCDGTSLTNLTSYDMTYGQKRVALPLTPLSYTVKGLTPGTWWFSLAAVTPTERSEFITVEKTVAPAEFVTTSTLAYAVVKGVDKLILVSVGSVPLGTVCNSLISVNGNYVVPRSAVTWSGTVKPDVVVARCG